MTDNEQAIIPAGGNAIQQRPDFEQLLTVINDSLSPTSQRVYRRTYDAWRDWCDEHGTDALDVTYDNVRAFLFDADVSKSTRQNRLSHMRKLAELLALSGLPGARQHYEAIKGFLKIKAQDSDRDRPTRNKRALSPSEANALLNVWTGDSPLELRNNAMIRLLLFTGLRRSELVALRWQDIDLAGHVVTVRHGKGDKARETAIMDNSSRTQAALDALHDAMGHGCEYVFGGLTRHRKPSFGDDKPTTDKTVDRVVKATAQKAGLGDLAPHDLRRTHITEYLATGGAVHDAQAQAGHARGDTTLGYAQAVDAEQRHASSRFRFL